MISLIGDYYRVVVFELLGYGNPVIGRAVKAVKYNQGFSLAKLSVKEFHLKTKLTKVHLNGIFQPVVKCIAYKSVPYRNLEQVWNVAGKVVQVIEI